MFRDVNFGLESEFKNMKKSLSWIDQDLIYRFIEIKDLIYRYLKFRPRSSAELIKLSKVNRDCISADLAISMVLTVFRKSLKSTKTAIFGGFERKLEVHAKS